MKNSMKAARYKKVLLIDDDKVDRYISEKIITTANFAGNIIVQPTASDALDYLKSIQDTPRELPEIIFLDIDMPGMNGFDFLSEFQKLNEVVQNRCRVFILTNFPDSRAMKDNIDSAKLAAEGILGKPLSKEVLSNI